MSEAAAENQRRADVALQQLEAAYLGGLQRLGLSASSAAAVRTAADPVAELGIIDRAFLSDGKKTALQELGKQRENLESLAGPYRSWAANGRRGDGTPYSWEQWFAFSRDVNGAIVQLTGSGVSSGYLEAAKAQAAELAAELQAAAAAANPANWGTGTKVAVAGGAVVLLLAVVFVATR